MKRNKAQTIHDVPGKTWDVRSQKKTVDDLDNEHGQDKSSRAKEREFSQFEPSGTYIPTLFQTQQHEGRW